MMNDEDEEEDDDDDDDDDDKEENDENDDVSGKEVELKDELMKCRPGVGHAD